MLIEIDHSIKVLMASEVTSPRVLHIVYDDKCQLYMGKP